MSLSLLSAWTQSAWQSAQAQLSSPPWLLPWRERQLQEFLKLGFPKPSDENWKYTQVAPLLEQAFLISEPDNRVAEIDLSQHIITDSYRLVFIDGVFSPSHSSLADLPEKMILMNGHEAMIQYKDLYQQLQAAESSSSALSVFHWLNGAFMSDGLFVVIPDHVQLTRPIHLHYINTGYNSAAVMRYPRHLIQLGAHSQASILEEYHGRGDTVYFNNVMTKISVGPNARLNYYKLQAEIPQAFHIANTHIHQLQDSQVRAYHLALGSRLNREDLNVCLNQSGASCELSGFYYPKAQQHIDFHTRLDHQSSHTHSQQYYKGMIAERGRGVFNGKIIAHPQVKQVTAKQQNHNLLLAKSAEINTKPELEVFADDVQCTHGATIGNLDADALFYLCSRGIPESLARRLLMSGFVNDILERFPDQSIAAYIKNQTGIGD